MRPITLSIVVPCYHDAHVLERLFGALSSLENMYPFEVIVVDASTDANQKSNVFDIVERVQSSTLPHGCQSVQYIHTHPCRGYQLNQGAQLAKGDYLWFLHADAIVNVDMISALNSAMKKSDAGYFTFKFSGHSHPLKWCLQFCILVRNTFGMAYGDQGIYIKRSLFNALGGFSNDPLFEEVTLIKQLKAKRIWYRVPCPIEVDARKWQQSGWVKRTFKNRVLAIKYMLGVPAQSLAKQYQSKTGSRECKMK